MRPEIVPSAIRSISAAELLGRDRRLLDAEPDSVERAEQIAHHPIGRQPWHRAPRRPARNNRRSPARRPARRRPRPRGHRSAMKRAFFASGSSGKFGAQPLDPFGIEHQRQQVGVGEVAVVVRFLLRAHRAGDRRGRCRTAGSPARPCRPPRSSRSGGAPRTRSPASTKRIELTFLISQRVPRGSPGRRTETLTSQRSEPSSMLPSQVPR